VFNRRGRKESREEGNTLPPPASYIERQYGTKSVPPPSLFVRANHQDEKIKKLDEDSLLPFVILNNPHRAVGEELLPEQRTNQ